MASRYRITNFGATRRLPYKGQCYEISHNSSIETNDKDIAVALSSFFQVDMEEILHAVKAPETPEVSEDKQQPDLSTMKKRELLELAEERGIELPEKITRGSLIEILNESDNKDLQND